MSPGLEKGTGGQCWGELHLVASSTWSARARQASLVVLLGRESPGGRTRLREERGAAHAPPAHLQGPGLPGSSHIPCRNTPPRGRDSPARLPNTDKDCRAGPERASPTGAGRPVPRQESSPVTGGCPHPKHQPQVPPKPPQTAVTGAGPQDQVTVSLLKTRHPEEWATRPPSGTRCPHAVGLPTALQAQCPTGASDDGTGLQSVTTARGQHGTDTLDTTHGDSHRQPAAPGLAHAACHLQESHPGRIWHSQCRGSARHS